MVKRRLERARDSRKLLERDGFLFIPKFGVMTLEDAEKFLKAREDVHTFMGFRRIHGKEKFIA